MDLKFYLNKFLKEDGWYTWIDYEKFNKLITEYYESNGQTTFTSSESIAKTPDWALYQSNEKGFDPVDNRWRRNKKGKIVERNYKSSDSGCG